MTRRDFHRYGTHRPGRPDQARDRRPGGRLPALTPPQEGQAQAGEDAFETLTSLSQLPVGVPRSFAIIEDATDAWVKYPRSRSARSG